MDKHGLSALCREVQTLTAELHATLSRCDHSMPFTQRRHAT